MRFAHLFVILCSVFLVHNKGLGWGHSQPVMIDHVAKEDRMVSIGVVPFGLEPKVEFTHFSLKNGKNLVVAPANAEFPSVVSVQKVAWPKGKLLVFVESARKNLGQDFKKVYAENSVQLGLMDVQSYKKKSESDVKLFMIPVASVAHVNQAPTVQPWVDSMFEDFSARPATIDSAHLRKRLSQMTGGESFLLNGQETWLRERQTNAARSTTQKYLVQAFQEIGLEAKIKCYEGMYRGCNVEAFKRGSDATKVYLFTAHMDAVSNTNGADDNASSSAAVLEIARVLSQENLRYTAGFVLFDQEELGLIGSRAYADSWPSSQGQILGVFNMDMIGYDSDNDGKMHIIDCDRPDSVGLTEKLLQVNSELQGGLTRVNACTNRSDHANFWRKNIPAVAVSENFFGNDGNNCYHATCDKVTNMNMDFYEKMVKLLASTATTLLLP